MYNIGPNTEGPKGLWTVDPKPQSCGGISTSITAIQLYTLMKPTAKITLIKRVLHLNCKTVGTIASFHLMRVNFVQPMANYLSDSDSASFVLKFGTSCIRTETFCADKWSVYTVQAIGCSSLIK